MEGLINVIFSTEFLFTTFRVMTPVLFAALACMVFGKGGIDAIATEGIMLIAALSGVMGSFFFNSAFMGVVVAIVSGILIAMVFGYITINLGSEPILAGIAVNTFATGITIFIVYLVTGSKGSTQSLNNPVVPNMDIPLIKDIPFIGEILSGHNILTYIAVLSVFLLGVFLYKTPTGLRIRTVGENEEAALSVGINVRKYQNITLVVAGSLAGLGGSFMSLGYVSFFSREMVAGRGFIGMAAESMGRGTPIGSFISSVFFGMADSFSIQLQLLNFPPQLIQLLPYLITIVAIAIYSSREVKKKVKKSAVKQGE